MLGSYYNKDKGLEFTPAAKQFDEKCNSKLSSLAKKWVGAIVMPGCFWLMYDVCCCCFLCSVRFCPKLGLGECQVFYDVVPEYAGVALVGLGSQDALLDDSVEERNEQKENIRIAAGGVKTVTYFISRLLCSLVLMLLLGVSSSWLLAIAQDWFQIHRIGWVH